MTSKTCTRCEQEKPLSAFSKGGKWRGTQLYKSVCKECTNVAMRGERTKDGEIVRNHHENVTLEKSPHGHGLRRVPIKGWGFLGATR